jgi:hypothetical protein
MREIPHSYNVGRHGTISRQGTQQGSRLKIAPFEV